MRSQIGWPICSGECTRRPGNARTSAARRPQAVGGSGRCPQISAAAVDRGRDPHTPGVILLRRVALALLCGLLAGCWPSRHPASRPRSHGCPDRPAGRWPARRRSSAASTPPSTSTGQGTEGWTWPPGRASRSGRRWPAPSPSPARWPGAGWSASTTERAGRPTSRWSRGCAPASGSGSGEPIGRVAAGGHCAGRCLHWGLRRGETYLDPLLLIRTGPSGPLRLLGGRPTGGGDRAGPGAGGGGGSRGGRGGRGLATAFGAVGPGGGHGFGRPVPGAITSAFGMRFHPVLRRWKLHDGTDFGASCGTPIRAPYAGTVTSTYSSGATDSGCCSPTVRWTDVGVTTGYNHAIRYVVGPGDRVARGQLLGYVGSTGLLDRLPSPSDGLARRKAGGPDDLVLGIAP